ncbi:EAL domain-containing protein [Dechloromonas sp.]|uniref:bifunctional diguanylate cyclase/phosphodiesterase n=1 Tax=Dechloromonas sp. TaxID=1917218 RepID=UPI00263F9589|nr:EAL domain-containing protein [Dechloromonas sp.]
MRAALRTTAETSRHLWVALCALAAAAFVLLAYVLWSTHQATWDQSRALVRSQAGLIESRLDATLRRIDASLGDLATSIPDAALNGEYNETDKVAIEARMARHLHSFPELSGFGVIDQSGRVRYLAGGGEHAQLDDRPYFISARDVAGDGLVFSEVVISRITGHQVLVVARAVRDAQGRFLGIVSAALELAKFEALFAEELPGKTGALAVRRSDNHALVVRYPPVPDEINRSLGPTHPLIARIAAGEREETLSFAAQADGVQRIYAFRKLEHYPFYVLAGLSEADALVVWRERAWAVGTVGGALFLCLGVVMYGLFRAQAQAHAAATALAQHRQQLREAQRLAKVGSWELDLQSNVLTWSDELFQIFELDPAVTATSYELFLSYVHPEDRALLERSHLESVANRSSYDIEHRVVMPDGRIKYLRECGETFYRDDGTPLRSIGTAQDVTSRRQMEAKMQLLGSAFQHSGEAILISDHDNNIVTVNPAFSQLTGYSAEEAIGRNPRFLSAGRTSGEEYAAMWASIHESGFWQGEIWDRRKDGGVYPKWMSVSVIRDDEGSIRYHIAHFTDVSSERAAEAKLHHMAHHDVLTGLLNRFSLKGRLDQALAAARRDGGRVAVMFIDLDRFKLINDTLGHHVGDLLLIDVANRLRDAVRDSDVVARLGGDEFVVMLTAIENSSGVALVAEKLVKAVGELYVIEGHDLYITPSIGIAIFPTDGGDGDVLMKNADAAMYHAKNAGRNNFQFFDEKMNSAALERLNTEHALRQALSREEFRLHFQPVIDVSSGRVAGVEALIRWQHPEKGLLAPGRFIGIAEETGLIQPIGEWVFWAACRQLAEFNAIGLTGICMGINISAIQMRNGNLPILARGAIEAYGLNPGQLVFAITESVAMEQPAETIRILDILHDMGIQLAIDDFGTGYSSLAYLRMFPIHHLKLDRSFVEEIGQTSDGSVISDATIGLAHNLQLKIAAEGVETAEQFDYLKAQGCDLVQGYLFSHPLPSEAVIEFICQRNG